MKGITVKTSFVLEWYDKRTEKIVGELKIEGIRFGDLKSLLRLSPSEDLRAGGFPVSGEALEALSARLGIRADDSSYDYFVFELRMTQT
jgi:hypothetical protein